MTIILWGISQELTTIFVSTFSPELAKKSRFCSKDEQAPRLKI
ncbi:hypothetical protein [Peribacillus simplex]